MFEYKCKLVKVVDGDTVDVDIDLGFGVWLQNQRIRLYGIDTPESRTSDAEEKIYGLAAKERMQKWLDGGSLKIVTHKDAKGKYGRILGELYTFETNINDIRTSKDFQNVKNGCNTNNPTSHCKNCSYKELVPMLSEIGVNNIYYE